MLMALSEWLFNASNLTPHGFCLVWDPALIWTYAISDASIALAYFSIPVALLFVASKRRDLVFRPMLWLFAAFILLCGTTHWLDILTLWAPVYGLQAMVKASTALVSVATAIALWWYLPHMLAFPSPAQMRSANEALLSSREQLAQAQKMEAVGQLTGGVAHDFNNLLQVVTGSLSLLEKRIAQGRVGEIGRYTSAMRQALETAARLTNRLLAFSRRQALQPVAVDMDALVAGIGEMLRRTLGPGIRLNVKLHDGRWSAFCDVAEFESALLNLAINARDAMPEGGVLELATTDRLIGASDLATGEGEPGRYIEIRVTDSGVGMSPDVLARVFEPFFTTKPVGQGTGLGLSQVYGFAKQSGGFLRLESAPGQGTTVRLYLPGHEKSEAPPEPARAAAEPGGSVPARSDKTRSVLVVEDDPEIRAQIAEALDELSLQVVEAADGQAGLTFLRSAEPIDLLVTDVGLPGLNGRQLAEAGRQVRPELPVLLITGYLGTALREFELAQGMAVLRKPFSLEELKARVRALLDGAAVDSPTTPADTASHSPPPGSTDPS